MKQLTKEDQAALRRSLEAEIARVERELAELRLIARDAREQDHDPGFGNHPADDGSETFEQERDLALEQNLQHLLDQAQVALSRLDAGVYGLCENCGQPISAERLRAMPSATLCMSCKTAQELRPA
jgi:RNA polymerase-binding protein DksA